MPIASLSNMKGTTHKYGIAVGDPLVYPSEVFIKGISLYKPILTPASVAANTTAEQTFTVSGLGANDVPLDIIKPTVQAGLGIAGYRVTAANTIGIWFVNVTGTPIVPTGGEAYLIPVLNVT